MTSWLGLHILGTDQSLARQIVAIAAGATPAQAWESEANFGASNSTQALLKVIVRLYHALAQQNAVLIRRQPGSGAARGRTHRSPGTHQ